MANQNLHQIIEFPKKLAKIEEIFDEMQEFLEKLDLCPKSLEQDYSSVKGKFLKLKSKILRIYQLKYHYPILRPNENFSSHPYIEWLPHFARYLEKYGMIRLIRPETILTKKSSKREEDLKLEVRLDTVKIGELEFSETHKSLHYHGKIFSPPREVSLSYNFLSCIREDGWDDIIFP